MIKYYAFKILNLSLGRVIRLLQSFLLDTRVTDTMRVTEYVHREAITKSAQYATDFMRTAIMCSSRTKLWDYALSKIEAQQPVFLEFGVHEGYSIKYFSSKLKSSKVFGFDSFLGLQEDWFGFSLPKGTFNLAGKVPVVPEGVSLIAGWFEETLPVFLKEHPELKVDLLHMDADTYTPTSFVLKSLSNRIVPGTVLIFDEYFGYNNWESHEHKAFLEFVNENGISYEYIAFSDMQVAVLVI